MRNENNFCVIADPSEQFKTVFSGHLDVKEDQVRSESLYFFSRGSDGIGFTDYVDMMIRCQHGTQILSRQAFVIDDESFDTCMHGSVLHMWSNFDEGMNITIFLPDFQPLMGTVSLPQSLPNIFQTHAGTIFV